MASNDDDSASEQFEETVQNLISETKLLTVHTEIVQPLLIQMYEIQLEKLTNECEIQKKISEDAAKARKALADLSRVVENIEQVAMPVLQLVPQLQAQINNLFENEYRRNFESIQAQSQKDAVMNKEDLYQKQLIEGQENLLLAQESLRAELERVQVAQNLLDEAEKKRMDEETAFIIKMLTIREQLKERNAKIAELDVQIKNAEAEKDRVLAENKAVQSQLKLYMTGMNAPPMATSSSSADGLDSSLMKNPTSKDTAISPPAFVRTAEQKQLHEADNLRTDPKADGAQLNEQPAVKTMAAIDREFSGQPPTLEIPRDNHSFGRPESSGPMFVLSHSEHNVSNQPKRDSSVSAPNSALFAHLNEKSAVKTISAIDRMFSGHPAAQGRPRDNNSFARPASSGPMFEQSHSEHNVSNQPKRDSSASAPNSALSAQLNEQSAGKTKAAIDREFSGQLAAPGIPRDNISFARPASSGPMFVLSHSEHNVQKQPKRNISASASNSTLSPQLNEQSALKTMAAIDREFSGQPAAQGRPRDNNSFRSPASSGPKFELSHSEHNESNQPKRDSSASAPNSALSAQLNEQSAVETMAAIDREFSDQLAAHGIPTENNSFRRPASSGSMFELSHSEHNVSNKPKTDSLVPNSASNNDEIHDREPSNQFATQNNDNSFEHLSSSSQKFPVSDFAAPDPEESLNDDFDINFDTIDDDIPTVEDFEGSFGGKFDFAHDNNNANNGETFFSNFIDANEDGIRGIPQPESSFFNSQQASTNANEESNEPFF